MVKSIFVFKNRSFILKSEFNEGEFVMVYEPFGDVSYYYQRII